MAKESAFRNDIWKWLTLALIAVVSIYVTNPPKEKFRFGLDLKGGTSFTLGVDTEKLRETIIAENPAITNTPGAVERKMEETLAGCDDRRNLPFHQMLLNNQLPLTIGGGIGQSRLCMFFLRKAHIGEVQASVWPQEMIDICEENNIHLL